MMGFKLLMVFVVLHSVSSNEVQNGTVTSYDPSALLLKIFNPNNTVVPRQAGYGFRFEDNPQSSLSGPADEDHGQYGLITLDDKIPIRFQDDGAQNLDLNVDIPVRSHPSGPVEDQGQYGLIIFDDNTPLRFQDDGPINSDPNVGRPIRPQNSDPNVNRPVKFEDSDLDRPSSNFQDDNRIDNHNKRKRRRRRKPKRLPHQPGLENPGVPGVPGVQGGPGYPGVYGNPGPYQGYGAGYGYPGLQGVRMKRRRRRPRPSSSLASDALTAVTGALTSIARYDDYQCVPRLLCEAAGGGALGSGGVLDSIAGIQPLLTLLSAYNGISSSPLFVFGRAVFLGMTSKGNTGTCRYAYSQCPNDPEHLIHYLNNHNGGFFRFFNAPPNQNLEQFYQHLGQNGLYQGQNGLYLDQNYYQPGQNGQYQPSQNGQYQSGFNSPYQPGQNYYQADQTPGQSGSYTQNQFSNHGNYGIYPQKPSLYGSQNYGQNYAYDYNNYGGKLRFRNIDKIEKRIQNKPAQEFVEDLNEFSTDDENIDNLDFENNNVRWAFPDDFQRNDNNIRNGKTLRFPEDGKGTDTISVESNRKGKTLHFPNNNYSPNKQYNQNYGVKYVNHNDFKKIKNQHSSTNRPNSNNNNHNQNANNYTPSKNFNNYNNNNYKPSISFNNNYKPPNNFNNNYKSPNNNNNQNTDLNNNDYYYDHIHNFYVKKDDNPSDKVYDKENGVNGAYANNYKPPNNFNNYNINNYKPSNSFTNNYKPPNNFNNNYTPSNNYNNYSNNNYKPSNSFTNNYKPPNNFNNNYTPSNNYNNYNNNYKPNNFNNNDYYYDHKHNFYVKKENNPSNKVYDKENNGVNTVYIVRGNGDPNRPEIVKLRPGESAY